MRKARSMSEGYEWTKARTFLSSKYGADNILSMSAPLASGEYWFARVQQGERSFGVEFRKWRNKWQCKELRTGK